MLAAPAPSEVEVFIGLGSNLGQLLENLRAGLAGIRELEGYRYIGQSSCYITAPVGRVDQPAFVNAVVRGIYGGTALQLLDVLLEIEARQGRQRLERWGPRTLDLDLLLFGDQVLDLPELKVPHPEMHRRAFVLVPLQELSPQLVLPVWGQTAEQLLECLTPAQRGSQKVEKVPWGWPAACCATCS
ncbi:2-amino-4-hydroxy-6-hydroxymethyldihydropteridinediphosphokinase [Desulfarculales bacterium]